MRLIDNLLSRLEMVKPTGERRWLAVCPAHHDHDPSMSIKQTEDGRVLIHCFAGCVPAEILQAVGLTLSDLFPDSGSPIKRVCSGPSHEAIEWANLISLVANNDHRNGVIHSPEDIDTINKARAIFDAIPILPKPTEKPKLAPFSKILHDRQRYRNLPFLVVVCAGSDAWDRAKDWSKSPNDIVGLVLPDAYPALYLWPVSDCNVVIERDFSVGDVVTIGLAQKLLKSGAICVAIRTLGVGIEKIYRTEVFDNAA